MALILIHCLVMSPYLTLEWQFSIAGALQMWDVCHTSQSVCATTHASIWSSIN